MTYVYTGTYVEYLEDGAPLCGGDTTDVADQRLIDAGLLIPTTTETVAEPTVAATVTTDLKETGADAAGN